MPEPPRPHRYAPLRTYVARLLSTVVLVVPIAGFVQLPSAYAPAAAADLARIEDQADLCSPKIRSKRPPRSSASACDLRSAVSDVAVAVDGPTAAVRLGSAFNYTVRVTNNGPDDATDVTISLAGSTRLAFISASGKSPARQGRVDTACSLPRLGPDPVICRHNFLGAKETWITTIVSRPMVAGELVITVASTASTVDPSDADNTAITTLVVNRP